jgi:hypothetical protein
MIDGDGNARLTDFGIAGLAEEIHADEVSAGTPAYMAPEQLDGKTPTVRSDIYSLGLVLYELFTGKRAFDAPTLGELIKLRRSDSTPTIPTSIVKDLDPVIESVIERCIQKDPARRPSSALQVSAARNLQLGRGDKRSAFRVAIFIFLVSVTGGLLGAHHVPDLGEELGLITLLIAFSLAPAALIWLLYIALEPHVRRRWPRLIISWTRLMAGNYRDPMVGRDLLIGGLFGLIHGACIPLGLLLTRWFGFEAPPIITVNVITLDSLRRLLAVFLNSQLVVSVFVGFAFLFFLLLLYIILRKEWLAALALFLIAVAIEISAFAFGGPRLFWVASILVAAAITIVVARFGLLATMVAQLFFFLSVMYPLTTNFSVWYASPTIFSLVVALGLAIYGFYISIGGKPEWKRFYEMSQFM